MWRVLKNVIKRLKLIRNFKGIWAPKYYNLLLEALAQYIAVICSFFNELTQSGRVILLFWEWVQFVRFLMTRSLVISIMVWFLFVGILGIFIGALLTLYKKEKNRNLSPLFFLVLFLLLLMELLSESELDHIITHCLQYLNWVLRPSDVRENLLSFKTLEINDTRLFKVRFEDKNLIQVPEKIPIIIDPFIWIGDDLEIDTADKYKFELFEFYKNSKLKKLKL
jgi:hypothetical protein